MPMHQDDSTGDTLSATSQSITAGRVKTRDHHCRSRWLRKAGMQLEKHTVDVEDMQDGCADQEFQEKTRHIKIIQLKAEVEAKHALLAALVQSQQKVDHERDREVMRSGCNASVDKHEASVADDKLTRCAKEASHISCARHSVTRNTSQSAHDEPKPNNKVGFFKALAKSIRTKREEAMTRQARQEILELLLIK